MRSRAALSEPKAPSFCRISGDLAPSPRKSLAIAIVRFWCAKLMVVNSLLGGRSPATSAWFPLGNVLSRSCVWRECLLCYASLFWLDDCSVFIWCLFCYLRSWLVILERLSAGAQTFGVLVLCRVVCPFFAPPGPVPVVGGTCTPRYCGPPG